MEQSKISSVILIIEDDEDIRSAFKFALEFEGYEVFEAENGKIGIDKLKNGLRPALVFLDLMMPVMDGVSFLNEISKDSALSKTPVVVVSANVKADDDYGVTACLPKPFDLEEIAKIASQFCTNDHNMVG